MPNTCPPDQPPCRPIMSQRRGLHAAALMGLALLAACGGSKESTSDLDIRGGRFVNSQAGSPYNHVVMLGPGNTMNCSGTMIAPDLVLTATHCIQGKDMRSYHVFFGTDIATAKKTRVLDHRKNYLRSLQPSGSMSPTEVPTDYALLKIGATARGMRQVPLHTQSLPVNTMVKQVGYGTNDQNQVGRLKENDTSVVQPGSARSALIVRSSTGSINPGDSGGPLFVRSGTGWAVAGVVSACSRGNSPYCKAGSINLYVALPTIMPTLRSWAVAMTGRTNPFGTGPTPSPGGGGQSAPVEDCNGGCTANPSPIPDAGDGDGSQPPQQPQQPQQPPLPPHLQPQPPQCTPATAQNWLQFRDNPEPGCVWCQINRARGDHLTPQECLGAGGQIINAGGVPRQGCAIGDGTRAKEGQKGTRNGTPVVCRSGKWEPVTGIPRQGCKRVDGSPVPNGFQGQTPDGRPTSCVNGEWI